MMRRMQAADAPWTPRRAPAAHSLVLFVGFGEGAPPDFGDGLARAGIRGLWLAQVTQALAAAAHARFDAVVIRLDESVALAARQLGAWRQVLGCPILLLAELEDEVDEIIALEMGADGLLAQPVSWRRLRAHLLMLLRRAGAPAGPGPAPVGAEPLPAAAAAGWQLDRVHNRLLRGDRRVALTDVQAALLQVLMDDLGRVVPRARLLAAVSHRRALRPRSVDVYVGRLRLRLAEARVDDLQLEGVRGRGYRLAVAAPPSSNWPQAGVADLLDWAGPAIQPLPLHG